jgi:polyferredoxin
MTQCLAFTRVWLLLVVLQDREHNVALTVFWAGWWPLVLLSYHFVGRAWCAVW